MAVGDKEELEALRRLAELEAKAGSSRIAAQIENDPISQGARNFAKDMPALQQFNAGMGGAFQNIIDASKQMVGMGPNAQQVQERRALDAPLNATGAGLAGNIAGNVAALAPLAVVPGANTVGGAATIGALAGALSPTTGAAERLGNQALGGVLGGGVQAVAQNPVAIWEGAKTLAQAPFKGVKAAVEPLYENGRRQILARALDDATGGNSRFVINNLRNAQELVPGSYPTAAEAAQSGGIAAMQRSASAVDPEAYATRAMQQNEARVKTLLDLAGTEGQRQSADAARTGTANVLYKAARDAGIDPEMAIVLKPQIKNLMQRAPSGVIQKARELARMNGEVMDKTGSITGLHYMKKAVDDLLSSAPQTGIGKETLRAVAQYKDDLLTVMDELSPAYGQARSTFAAMSKPISQMDVAQTIADKSISPLTGNLKPEMYARALSDDTASTVTGMRNATLKNTLEPKQLQALTGIKEDLARAVMARDLGRGPGSDTTQKLAMTNLMQRAGIPVGVLKLPLAGRVGNWLYEQSDQRMREQLAKTLLDPRATADLMETIKPVMRIPESPKAQRDIAAILARMLVTPSSQTLEKQGQQ